MLAHPRVGGMPHVPRRIVLVQNACDGTLCVYLRINTGYHHLSSHYLLSYKWRIPQSTSKINQKSAMVPLPYATPWISTPPRTRDGSQRDFSLRKTRPAC